MGKIEKIKMKDFKSFRTAVIPFLDGFVCVVGPNGSGKSNIVDAILFVLGEGSMKALRAGRVKDLVHHSSRTGTAEVTIELRRGTDKLSITREIDKQGNSVYRLNGKRTTRMEIQETIASIGIPPEGYNIIMQGDVEGFIKMSPTQRREVIDEIAGVSEYEEKKSKAMLELSKVEDKIKEAEILLHERKGYIGELKKERNEAIRYKKYKEKADLIRANLLKRQLDRFEKALAEKINFLNDKKAEHERLSSEWSEIDAKLKRLQGEIDGINKEIIAKGEKEQLGIAKQIESTRTEIKYLQENYAEKTERKEQVNTEMSIIKKDIIIVKGEINKRTRAIEKLEKELQSIRSRIKKKQQELDEFVSSMKERDLLVTNISEKLEEFEREIRKNQEEYYVLLSSITGARERISVLKFTQSNLSKTGASKDELELESRLKGIDKDLVVLRKKLLEKENELEKLFSVEKQLNEEYKAVDSKIDSLKEKYHSIYSRIATIRSMTGNEGSEAVLSAAKRGELSGIIGRVKDLCEHEEEYTTAIQVAAGSRLEYIITRDDVSAARAVKWLKSRKIGRTTFIPLNKIKGQSIEPSVRRLEKRDGVLGFAIDLVKFDPSLKKAFEYVFGDTLIVESVDVAKSIGFGTVRMATLDGDLAESSGALTGGYRHGGVTLKELMEKDKLKKDIEKYTSDLDKLLRKIEGVREKIEEKRKEKSSVEVEVKQLEAVRNQIETRLSDYLTRKSAIEKERKSIDEEINKLSSEIKSNEEKSKVLRNNIESLEKRKLELQSKLKSKEAKEATMRMERMQREINVIRNQSTEVEIRLNAMKSELSAVLESKLARLNKREVELENEKAKLEEFLKDAKEKIFNLETKLQERIKQEEELSGKLSGLMKKREDFQSQIGKLAEKKGSLQRLMENIRQEINRIELEKARLETRLSDLRSEWEELSNLEFEELSNSTEELEKGLEDLKKKMTKLEPINMKSIELYEKALDELKTVEEKADKLKSEKEAVIDLINKIESKKKEAFIQTYERIREHFKMIYKEFYPEEGTFADIKLEDTEDPFQGGLIIEARPAGRPVKRIEALSGGEKAVVALTFLFAIQAYKPSPFYILDEADSPLDRANSERLAKMIKSRIGRSQFIVVTHNATLIHEADQIIGVSMNKKIGSSVVEVNMKDYVK